MEAAVMSIAEKARAFHTLSEEIAASEAAYLAGMERWNQMSAELSEAPIENADDLLAFAALVPELTDCSVAARLAEAVLRVMKA